MFGHGAYPGKGHIHEIRQFHRQMTPMPPYNPTLRIQKTTMVIQQQQLAAVPVEHDQSDRHELRRLVAISVGPPLSGAVHCRNYDHTSQVWS